MMRALAPAASGSCRPWAHSTRGTSRLIEAAKTRTDFVAVTIFVNPLQFGPGEDLDRYPQTFESDLAGCRERDVDLVFAPAPESMYPAGFQTQVLGRGDHQAARRRVSPGALRRCDHGRDQAIQPCRALRGHVRPQGLSAVEDPLADGPRSRHADRGCGMPHRSRARWPRSVLPQSIPVRTERARALGIVSGLRSAHDAWSRGERRPDTLRSLAAEPVHLDFDRVDYVAVVDPDTLVTPARVSVPFVDRGGRTPRDDAA